MQVKDKTIVVLIYVVTVASMALMLPLAFHVSPADAGLFRGPLVQQESLVPTLKVRKNGSDTIVDVTVWHGKYQSYNGEWLISDQVEVEVDGVSHLFVLCEGLCAWNRSIITNCTEAGGWQTPENFYTLHVNLGEVTGTPPKVRARARTQDCATNLVQAGDVLIKWSDWTTLQTAEVYQPPIIEIAAVIGVAGLAIGVANNYWSGRREGKATEIARTAAVDERFMELYNASREIAFQETMAEVLYQYQWTDYEDFLSKYGPETDVRAWAKIQSLTQYFEGIGVMVQTESVDLDQVYRLLSNQIISVWEKLDDVILEQRRRELNPTIYGAFERLYYAIKKYQQEGPSQPDEGLVHKFE